MTPIIYLTWLYLIGSWQDPLKHCVLVCWIFQAEWILETALTKVLSSFLATVTTVLPWTKSWGLHVRQFSSLNPEECAYFWSPGTQRGFFLLITSRPHHFHILFLFCLVLLCFGFGFLSFAAVKCEASAQRYPIFDSWRLKAPCILCL